MMSMRQFFILNSVLLFIIKLVWQKLFYPQNPLLPAQVFEFFLIAAIIVLILRNKAMGRLLLFIYLLINAFIFLVFFTAAFIGHCTVKEFMLVLLTGLLSILSLIKYRREFRSHSGALDRQADEEMPSQHSNSASLNQPPARTYIRDAPEITVMWFNRIVLGLQVGILIKAISVAEQPWTGAAVGLFVVHFLIILGLDTASKSSDVKVGHIICTLLFLFLSFIMYFILLQAQAF